MSDNKTPEQPLDSPPIQVPAPAESAPVQVHPTGYIPTEAEIQHPTGAVTTEDPIGNPEGSVTKEVFELPEQIHPADVPNGGE